MEQPLVLDVSLALVVLNAGLPVWLRHTQTKNDGVDKYEDSDAFPKLNTNILLLLQSWLYT